MKLVLVGMSAGRCGSSAVMGLLKIAGCDVGRNLTPGNKLNPKGYFEQPKIQGSQEGIFNPHIRVMRDPMPIDYVIDRCKNGKKRFVELINQQYDTRRPIAIKARSCCIVGMFKGDPNVDMRVIRLMRNPQSQANSFCRIIGHKKDKILQWLDKRYKWTDAYLRKLGVKNLVVRFEDVKKNPVEEARRIYEFCGLQGDWEKVQQWIEPKLSRCG